MGPTISLQNRLSRNARLKKALLNCGILSSLLYAAMNVFVPNLFEGYNSIDQTISELSAVGAPTRVLWVWLGFVYSLLTVAFGWGILLSAYHRPLRMVGGLILLYGIISLGWPFAPMHQREVLAAGGGSMTDTLHLTLAAASVLLMTTAIGIGAVALGRRFRIYSIATLVVLLVFGALTGLGASKVEANLPTPFLGIWERINVGVFMLWVVILAILLLRTDKHHLKP